MTNPRTLDELTTTLSPAEAAERLGFKESTLRNMRWRGDGPAHVKLGHRVRYRLVDIAAYLDQCTRTSTTS